MKRFACVCSVAVALLSWATTADAANPPEGWGAAYYNVAQEYWGTTPECTVTVTYNVVIPPDDKGEIVGLEDECHLLIAHTGNILETCAVVVHEDGHALGLEHSADPNSVMYPFVLRRNIPSLCVDLLERYRPGRSRIALKRL